MAEKLFLFGCEESYFFRDGTPFTAGEDTFLPSSFPPSCNVVYGAVRTAIMRGHGLDFGEYAQGRCSVCDCAQEGCEVLKAMSGSADDPEDPGMDLIGPFVTRKTDSGVERLHKAPSDLVEIESSARELEFGRLHPSAEPVISDLGRVFMPASSVRCKSLSDVWISESGLLDYLVGADVGPGKAYYSAEKDGAIEQGRAFLLREERIGISRQRATRATKEGMLYAIEHIRLAHGPNGRFGMGARVRGCPDVPIPNVVRLGGEGRFTSLEVKDSKPFSADGIAEAIDRGPGLFGERGFKVVFMTPVKFCPSDDDDDGQGWLPPGFAECERDGALVWEGVLRDVRCTLVSVCSDRPVRIGGWSMVLNQPKPRLAYVPGGAVYYFTTPHTGAEVVAALHDTKVGMDTRIGFGHAVVGRW